MNAIAELCRRITLLLTRDRATRELEAEMRLHRELRSESLQARGMPAREANHAAQIRFGNAVRLTEKSRDAWGWGSFDELTQDLRYAARRLKQRPGFTVSVIAVLALGIGATTAMFSAVDAAMLRPLPFERPEELVTVRATVPSSRTGRPPVPENERAVDITDIARMTSVFTSTAAYASGGLNLSTPGNPLRVKVGVVTVDFFRTLGVNPVRGNVFSPETGVSDGPRQVVLSWGLWQRQFGGSDVIGTTLPLNGHPYEIVGVMPIRFGFPGASDLWVPMTIPTTRTTFEPFRGYVPSTTIARVAPGVSLEAAESQLFARWEQFAAGYPPPGPGQQSFAQRMMADLRSTGATKPLRNELVGDSRRALLVLLGATGLLLLIACTNVTNLLLAYGASRRRELAVRGVLGATRGRVVRLLLTESVLLSTAGAVAGVALAPVGLRMLRTLMPAKLDGLAAAQVDLRVLAFATILGLLTGIIFGMWPAFGATRESAATTIKTGGGHGATSTGARRAQRILVGAELALAMTLLIGSGLMLRSFRELMGLDFGFRTENAATLELSFARETGDAASRLARVDAIIERVRSIPGITAAGVINDLPLRGRGGIAIPVEAVGMPKPSVANGTARFAGDVYARYLVASEDYFKAIGIPLKRGRFFSRTDDAKAPQVALISEEMARAYWPGVDPVGRTFLFGGDPPPVRVIGVVADVRESGLEDKPIPQMYFPARTNIDLNLALVARGTLPRAVMLEQIRAGVSAVDRTQAVYNVRMMDVVVGASVAARRANTLLITLFGLLGLAVAVLGVYAVTSYAVAQRSRELGIRAALGATRPDLFRHIGNEMTWVALAGIAAGGGLAWALSRVMSSLVYGVTVHDLRTFVAAPLILLIAVVVATIVPARRATRVNPADVMRSD